MNVSIKGHPRERMAERGVTEEDVLSVVTEYSYSKSSQNGGSTVLFGTPRNDGRTLKVVLLGSPPKTDPYVVKTVAWRDEDDA